MRKSIDFRLVEVPPGDDDDLVPMSWIVGVADTFDDAEPRVFVVAEEQGQSNTRQTLYLTAEQTRTLRAALASALREIGEPPD